MRYRVLSTLGAGVGTSILLIADAETDARYALKLVERTGPEQGHFVDQVLHEFTVTRRLDHPNLLTIYDCRARRSWFRTVRVELLMELVDGRSLDALPRLEFGQIARVFAQVAAALEHMHRRGVFHGDLKPSNVMLSRAGDVKLIDFGAAAIKGRARIRIKGTPEYMAPEMAREVIDARTDLFALGATLYRLVTGIHANPTPSNGPNGKAAPNRPLRVTPPIELRPDLPGGLNEIVLACLAANPDHRPAGAFEVRAQLEAIARYLGTGPDEPRNRAQRPEWDGAAVRSGEPHDPGT